MTKPAPVLYDGPVVFVDGVHYPATDDDAGFDASRPLRWDESGQYRDAEEGEPLHNEIHHQNEVALDEALGGEQ